MSQNLPPSNPGGYAAALIAKSSPRFFAIMLVCVATILFSVMDAIAKYLAEIAEIPVSQVIWTRLIVHVGFTFLILGPTSLPRLVNSQKPGIQILRSLCLLGATAFNFIALKYLQLDQTVTIFFLSPLIVAVLAGPILGEWIGWWRLLAICFGFCGIILIMRPGFGGVHWAVFYALGAAISFSFYNILTRYLSNYDSSEVTQFFSPLVGAAIFAPFAFLDWQAPSSVLQWALLLSMGFIGGFGHWLLIIAHRYAPAPILGPFIYTGLLSMVIIGYFVFNDIPTVWTLAGASIVIIAGLYLLYRETSFRDE
ncbi:MAG: DMT family transporter [Pseudomonadota bacterium]